MKIYNAYKMIGYTTYDEMIDVASAVSSVTNWSTTEEDEKRTDSERPVNKDNTPVRMDPPADRGRCGLLSAAV